MKIQTNQRVYSINDIQRLFASTEMSVQPKYQRRRTDWPNNAKTALIGTIINNYIIPPIYLRDYVDENGKRRKEIIDGQQRIQTIIEFLNNGFKLTKVISEEELVGQYFKDLPNEIKINIEDYELAFISIKGANESDIISIFSRLNSYSLPLNTQEKRNAKYAGIFKSVVYDLASRYNTFWQTFKILSSKQIARMADALFVSEIVYAILKGIKSSTSKDIDNLYKEFDEEFDKYIALLFAFNKTMSTCGQFLEDPLIMKAFKNKYMFYSLFLAVYDKYYGIGFIKRRLKSKINIEESIKLLRKFSIKLIEERFSADELYLLKQATGNTKNRKFRHREISKLLK